MQVTTCENRRVSKFDFYYPVFVKLFRGLDLHEKMSTQKGNATRTRPQKHQNKTKYKNDLHDKSQKMKLVNSLEIDNVCIRCKDIIEWKIKYKKYKPLKSPATCVACHNKNVKHAYHALCTPCAVSSNVCPKCKLGKELVTSKSVKTVDDLINSSEVQMALKSLPERKRRTFYRNLNRSSFNVATEEEILNKIKDMSLGEKDSDQFSDDLEGFGNSEEEEEDDADADE